MKINTDFVICHQIKPSDFVCQTHKNHVTQEEFVLIQFICSAESTLFYTWNLLWYSSGFLYKDFTD